MTNETIVKAAKNTMVEMSAEELDCVSGGGYLSADSKFLNVLLRGNSAQPDRVGEWKAFWNSNNIKQSVQDAWKSVGVLSNSNCDYYIFYKTKLGYGWYPCTREQAMAHAQEVMGVSLSQSDWDW